VLDLYNITLNLTKREGLTLHIVPFSHVSDLLLAEQAQADPDLEVGP
jgi:hypothetical protein